MLLSENNLNRCPTAVQLLSKDKRKAWRKEGIIIWRGIPEIKLFYLKTKVGVVICFTRNKKTLASILKESCRFLPLFEYRKLASEERQEDGCPQKRNILLLH